MMTVAVQNMVTGDIVVFENIRIGWEFANFLDSLPEYAKVVSIS